MNLKAFLLFIVTGTLGFYGFFVFAETLKVKVAPIIEFGVEPNFTLEEYLMGKRKMFLKVSEGSDVMNEVVLSDIQDKAVKSGGRNLRSRILKFDENLDGSVTSDEIISMLKHLEHTRGEEIYEREKNKALSFYMKQDINGDGILTNEEMLKLPSDMERKQRGMKAGTFKKFFDVDPNKDNVLTLDEFEQISKHFFDSVDLNDDGTISKDEYSVFVLEKRSNKDSGQGVSAEALKNTHFEEKK